MRRQGRADISSSHLFLSLKCPLFKQTQTPNTAGSGPDLKEEVPWESTIRTCVLPGDEFELDQHGCTGQSRTDLETEFTKPLPLPLERIVPPATSLTHLKHDLFLPLNKHTHRDGRVFKCRDDCHVTVMADVHGSFHSQPSRHQAPGGGRWWLRKCGMGLLPLSLPVSEFVRVVSGKIAHACMRVYACARARAPACLHADSRCRVPGTQ